MFLRIWKTIKTIDVFVLGDYYQMEVIFKSKYDFNPIVAHDKVFVETKYIYQSYHWYAIKNNTTPPPLRGAGQNRQ